MVRQLGPRGHPRRLVLTKSLGHATLSLQVNNGGHIDKRWLIHLLLFNKSFIKNEIWKVRIVKKWNLTAVILIWKNPG